MIILKAASTQRHFRTASFLLEASILGQICLFGDAFRLAPPQNSGISTTTTLRIPKRLPTRRLLAPPSAIISSIQKQRSCYHTKKYNNGNKLSMQNDHFYGGDYAGQLAKFNSQTGSLIPVPEYLLPESFVEWEVTVPCLELITSEDIIPETGVLERAQVEVLPAAGCGVDNLDTELRKSVIPIGGDCEGVFWDDIGIGCDLLVYPSGTSVGGKSIMESIFIMKTSEDCKRIRVLLEIDTVSLSSTTRPIEIVVERKTSSTSTQGTIADGGGLTGNTVANLVGIENINRPFAGNDDSIVKVESLLGEWTTKGLKETVIVVRAKEEFENLNGEKDRCLFLPAGVVVHCNYEKEEQLSNVIVSCLQNGDTRIFIKMTFTNDDVLGAKYWIEKK